MTRHGSAAIVLGVVAGGILVAAAAYAAEPSGWTGGSIATGTVGITGCSTTADSISTAISGYHAGSQSYEVRSVGINSVQTACQKPFRLTVTDAVSDGAALPDGVATGTLAAADTTVSFVAGSGPEIEGLNDTNGDARVVVIIRGP